MESPIIFQNSEESFDFVGLYDEFFNGKHRYVCIELLFSAREQDKTYQFLKIPPPEGSREHILWKKENEPEPEPEAEEAAENTEAAEDTEINEESPG